MSCTTKTAHGIALALGLLAGLIVAGTVDQSALIHPLAVESGPFDAQTLSAREASRIVSQTFDVLPHRGGHASRSFASTALWSQDPPNPQDGDVGSGPVPGDGLLRWPEGAQVEFFVNGSDAPTGAADAVRRAIETWLSTGIELSLDYAGTTDESGANEDLINVVSWVPTPNPRDRFVARTTVYWYADRPSEIIGFDLSFNLDHPFAIAPDIAGPLQEDVDLTEPASVTGSAGESPDPWGETMWDIETIALHEFGHVVGLGHADPERILQVMRPRIGAGDIDHRLSLRDIDALASLYGREYEPKPQGIFRARSPQDTTNPGDSTTSDSEDSTNPGLFD